MRWRETEGRATEIRLIVSDIDGTLLPRGGRISDVTRRAVERCWARGIPFVLATGRWAGAIGEVRRDLGLENRPCIIANGGAVLDGDGSCLREWHMREADARRAAAIAREYPVLINSYVRNGLYRLNVTPTLRRLQMYVGEGNPRIVQNDPAAFDSEGMRNVYKLEVLCENPSVLAELSARVRKLGLSVSSASPRNVEIMAPGCGKGTALRWLAGHLGAPRETVMAFGDHYNDLELLEEAGWPVAMGNSVDALKDAARIVAPACVEDGVARVLFERVLEEEP